MGPHERRARERDEMRTLILDAARELFAAEGVEAVTMRRIAERIEYSPTAIYFHFRDKESLLTELCDQDFRAFAQGFAAMAEIADPVERLRASGHSYVEFGLQNPSHYRLMFMTPKAVALQESSIRQGDPAQDAYAFLRGIVAEIIAAGRMREEYSDADLASQVIWGGVHGVVSLEIAKCNDDWVPWRTIAERTNATIDMIIAGMTR